MECLNCGMVFNRLAAGCPKCDAVSWTKAPGGILTVDVAHNGEDRERAREKIEQAASEALYYGHSGLRVIHGRGGRRGHGNRIARMAVPLLGELAKRHGGQMRPDGHNRGAHILWFD